MEGVPAEGLLRDITADEREAYAREGVVHLKAVIAPPWIEFLKSATDRLMSTPDPTSQSYTPAGSARFFSQVFPRLVDPAFDTWIRRGPTREIAAQIHPKVRQLRAFFDQVFAMEPGAPSGAPYHQDYPYLPVRGEHTFRIWVPLDVVTADGGAVRYLKGSHLGPVYRPRTFSGDVEVESLYSQSPYPEAPSYEANAASAAWLIGEAKPGDALLHHPKTVHGSPANATKRLRRAVTTMFVGDDVVWDARPGTSFEHMGIAGGVPAPVMPAGEPVTGDMFPQVWTRVAAG